MLGPPHSQKSYGTIINHSNVATGTSILREGHKKNTEEWQITTRKHDTYKVVHRYLVEGELGEVAEGGWLPHPCGRLSPPGS